MTAHIQGKRSRARLPAEPIARLITVPIYEYVCMSCESHFEELVYGDRQPACPDCGTVNVRKQMSVFAAIGSPSSEPTSYSAGGAGGCCGGSCGTC